MSDATVTTKPYQQAVEVALGSSVICSLCGATLATYADLCNVPLDVRCQGFETVEAAIAVARAKVTP